MEARIVGGGIAGLAAAAGLTRAGWRVRVHERAEALADDGTGLGMWPNAVRALGELGLADELRRRGEPQRPGVIRRWDGRTLAEIDTDRIRRRAGEDVYVVARPELLTLLFESLPAGTVHFGQEGSGDADVLVGADGAHSAVRQRLLGPRHGLRDTGFTVWRGVIDAGVRSAGEVWGPKAKFGYSPLTADRTNFYAVLESPSARRDPVEEHASLLAHFGRWPEPVPSVLRQASPEQLLRHSLHYLDPPLPSYVAGNVALVGDAAHTMTPDLGQGACQALLDGLTLARCLARASSSADVRAALREYDRRRRRPTQRIATAARWLGRVSTARRGTGVRDAVVRSAAALSG